MNIFEKIKEFRNDPKRKRVTVSFGHSIRIKEQGERKKPTCDVTVTRVAGGAGSLGTEVNAEGTSYANGLRVSSDDSLYSKSPELSENTFLPTERIINLDKGDENETKNDTVSTLCDAENDCHNSVSSSVDSEGDNSSCTCDKASTQGSSRGRVFSQKHTISFLLCDALVLGGVALGVKLLKKLI